MHWPLYRDAMHLLYFVTCLLFVFLKILFIFTFCECVWMLCLHACMCTHCIMNVSVVPTSINTYTWVWVLCLLACMYIQCILSVSVVRIYLHVHTMHHEWVLCLCACLCTRCIMNVSVEPTCMPVHTMHPWHPWKTEKCIGWILQKWSYRCFRATKWVLGTKQPLIVFVFWDRGFPVAQAGLYSLCSPGWPWIN